MPHPWTSVAHRQQALDAIARAEAFLDAGDYGNAHDAINEASRLIDEYGNEQDVVFMATLDVAADSALSIDEFESAAALYLRCANVGAAHAKAGADGVHALRFRAQLGLARCDIGRGSPYAERAPSRYAAAWQLIQDAGITLPEDIADEVSAGMKRTEPKRSNVIFGNFRRQTPGGRLSAREAHYSEFLGEMSDLVWHSTDDKSPHIDVYQFAPTPDRDFWTLVTGGMSDLRQPALRTSAGEHAPRAELLMYVREPKPWMADVLKGMAEMPFDDDTFLYWGHTVPNGKPMTAEPSQLTSFFFDMPYFEDPKFSNLTIEGDDVVFLWLRPITEAERSYAVEHGGMALSDLFASLDADQVVDEQRESLV